MCLGLHRRSSAARGIRTGQFLGARSGSISPSALCSQQDRNANMPVRSARNPQSTLCLAGQSPGSPSSVLGLQVIQRAKALGRFVPVRSACFCNCFPTAPTEGEVLCEREAASSRAQSFAESFSGGGVELSARHDTARSCARCASASTEKAAGGDCYLPIGYPQSKASNHFVRKSVWDSNRTINGNTRITFPTARAAVQICPLDPPRYQLCKPPRRLQLKRPATSEPETGLRP